MNVMFGTTEIDRIKMEKFFYKNTSLTLFWMGFFMDDKKVGGEGWKLPHGLTFQKEVLKG